MPKRQNLNLVCLPVSPYSRCLPEDSNLPSPTDPYFIDAGFTARWVEEQALCRVSLCRARNMPCENWSEWCDLNTRPLRPERSALPGCATLR